MKTSELQGAALDWAVAKCDCVDEDECLYVVQKDGFKPSTDWAQGGPIIERELIDIVALTDSDEWLATMLSPDYADHQCAMFGTTLLIAAMRCFVASKLGDEIEIPEELK